MKNYFDLTNKAALVTGVSSGLGVQFAKALANQGANLIIAARRVEKLEAVKAEIEKEYGVHVYAHSVDVSDIQSIKDLVADSIKEFGHIDILANNAGIAVEASCTEMSDEDWLKVVNVNLNGVYFMAREVGRHIKERHYGKIINIGSIHTSVAVLPLAISSYVTTKGAVKNLTIALATELAKDGITVNAIGPAYFASEMTEAALSNPAFQQVVNAYCPMGRIGQQGELDGALIYLASDASSYTTGQLISVDGGWTAI